MSRKSTSTKNFKKYLLEDEEEESESLECIKVIDNHIYFYSDVSIKSILELTGMIKKLTKELLMY